MRYRLLGDDQGVSSPFSPFMRKEAFYGKSGHVPFFGVCGWRGIIEYDIWSLFKFHVSLWALVVKPFCNYPLEYDICTFNFII